MRSIIKERKKGILLMCGLCLLFFICFFACQKDFHLDYFQKKLEIQVRTPFRLKNFDVCYGNFLKCELADYQMISEEIDTSKLGSYIIKYKLVYKNKEKEIEQEINIIDTEAPSLEIETDHISICPNGMIPDIPKKSIDNFQGDLTDRILMTREDNYILFEVSDDSGNKAQRKISSTVEDKEFPSIELKGERTIYLKLNETFNEPGFTAKDNCDGDLTEQVQIENNINPSQKGEYQIKYSVKDSSNNETSISRTVYIYESGEYPTPDGKSIYLTFDDGPSIYTGKLLDILKKYNVKATFFVTNQSITNGYDADIKRAYEEGHTIGLHTYSHDYKSVYASEEAYWADLYAIQKKVKDITGYESKIIRFPGGSSNTISKFNPGIMTRLTKEVEEKGFRYFDWNLDSDDAGSAKDSTKVASNVIKGLGSGSTYVVLQHDIKGYSVDAVETIIQYGLTHGYTFRALTMTSPNSHHRVNN